MSRLHRHHKNPLLRYFCPRRYKAFLKRDLAEVDASAHSLYHRRLSNSAEF